ncbi:MAG: hypothetical protein DRQ39_04065 [Gammaproteobacteria bacterium]|nr:MAG: hypothetical protein DRQ39_04065 [Gammaproteobacteria bacterium]
MPEDNSRNVVHIGGNKLGKLKRRADISRQTPDEDAFKEAPNSLQILSTPYSLQKLTEISQQSSIVNQCIDAMVANTASNGYVAVPVDSEKTLDDVAKGELATLNSYIQYANTTQNLTTLNELLKHDYETYGYSFREIIRSLNNKISGFRHVPAYNLRILTEAEGYVEVTKHIIRGGKRATFKERRLFRRYIQELSSSSTKNALSLNKGGGRVYFKEYGDPRRMNYHNGRYEKADYPVEDKDLATEVLHEKQISPDAYGIPKWASAMPAILGAREAEEVNLDYFESNTVPPAMLTVSGGRLTQKSFQAINELLEGDTTGKKRTHKMLLIEAIAESSGLEDTGQVRINLEKMSDARQSDGLFKDYEEAAQQKVQSIYRIPPVLLGLPSGNFANANTSIHVAETQVFQPNRQRHDDFWNLNIINSPDGLNLKTVKLQSKSMAVTESAEVVKAIATLNVAGAMTPRKVTKLARDVLGMDIDKYPEVGEDGYEEWMDVPTPLSTKSANENKPQAESTPSEASPETKLKGQETTGETKPPENSEK